MSSPQVTPNLALSVFSVVLIGDFSRERVKPAEVANEFGFGSELFSSMVEFDAAPTSKPNELGNSPVAVLLHESVGTTDWLEPLLLLTEQFPQTKVILCRRFGASTVETPADLAALGVFLTLRLPLQENELRQAFGFVWAGVQGKSSDEATGVGEQLAAMSRNLRREAQSEVASQETTKSGTKAG